jgi:hypothetical protein
MGPPDDPASYHKSRLRSEWIEGSSPYLSFNPMLYVSCKKNQLIQKNNNLRKTWLKLTYHRVLSSAFFCVSCKKSYNLYGTNKLFVSKWIIKLNKRINFFFILIPILPSWNVILPNFHCNNIVSSISFKFLLAVKICTIKFSLLS